MEEFNEIYNITKNRQAKSNDRLMKTLIVTQSRLWHDESGTASSSGQPKVVNKVYPDMRQSKKLHRKLEKLKHMPIDLAKMKSLRGTLLPMDPQVRSLPQIPVIHKPIFTEGIHQRGKVSQANYFT